LRPRLARGGALGTWPAPGRRRRRRRRPAHRHHDRDRRPSRGSAGSGAAAAAAGESGARLDGGARAAWSPSRQHRRRSSGRDRRGPRTAAAAAYEADGRRRALLSKNQVSRIVAKDKSTFRVNRPMLVVVLNAWVTETKD